MARKPKKRRTPQSSLIAWVFCLGICAVVVAGVVWLADKSGAPHAVHATQAVHIAMLPPPPIRGPEPAAASPEAGATAHARRPLIAICIDDLGANLSGTERAIALPRPVALAFFPFAPATPRLAGAAERAGHDVLAHVPMQTLEPVAPSPMTLTVGAPDNEARLAWNIARVPGLIGVNNHQGSRFTEDATSLEPVMQALAARHLFFFDSRTAPGTVAVAVARRHGLLSAGRDVFLDNVENDAAIRGQLDRLVAIAKRRGVAIAIGHPHDATLALLAAWLKADHGVTLVTLPDAMRMKETGAMAER